VKVAILSDVHANLEALTAVLEDVDSRSVDRILFLGDAVGYGADPAACLELLEKSVFRFVAGNHDHAAGNDQEGLEDLHEDAATAIRWTRGVLAQEAKERLQGLPLGCLEGPMHLVHGSPYKPEIWRYVMSEQDAERGFAASESRVIFVGHSHIPAAYVEVECKRLFTGVMRRIKVESNGPRNLDRGLSEIFLGTATPVRLTGSSNRKAERTNCFECPTTWKRRRTRS